LIQKLFTLGPVEMYEYTRERTLGQLPYFRTEEFSKINLECAERLKRLAGAPESAHVFLLTCSGTGAMEAVVSGCFCREDRLIVIDGGGFGHRFFEIAEHHGIPSLDINLKFGETLKPERLVSVTENLDFTGLLVNLHESATGQLYDKDMLASFCRAHGLYLVIDGIASFLTDPFDFGEDGADALIVSSQKALALPPGLAVVIMTDRMYKKISDDDIKPASMYFDFLDAEANALRGQTPFTPAIGLILALRERLEKLEEEGGYEASVARTKALAEDFRERIGPLLKEGVIAMPSYPLSNACTPLVFPNGGAKKVYETLALKKGIWLNPNGGELADNVLRVGHLGDITKEDSEMLAALLTGILV